MPPTLKRPDLLRGANLVAGEFVEGGAIPVTNPSTGETIATVPSLGRKDAARAIEAAARAQPAWAARTAADRGRILRRFHDLLVAHADDLAAIMTAEQGKPLAEAKSEILYSAGFVEWYAEEGKRAYGDILPPYAAGYRIAVLKQPVGVTAAITPWNFPSAMIARKLAPALAAGCAMVIRPASATPLSAVALAILALEAGVPAPLVSVLTGPAAPLADEFTQNPRVRKISFTGSTAVGREIMAKAAHHIQKVSLELGGNAPFLVFDDAALDAAAEGAIQSKFRNAGQTCVCANRIYVQAGIHDAFVAKLKEKVAALKVADGFEPGAEIGPLINAAGLEKVEAHVADALAKGATLETGGKVLHDLFFAPTLLTGLNADMRIAQEETFGPVAPVFRFDTEAEAIAAANDTPFGLASYFYARDIGRITRVSEALEYGIVGVNTGLISNASIPFGGVKASGLGREGARYGLDEYLEIKYVNIAL